MAQQQQDETLIALTAEVSQLNTEVTKLSQEVAKQTGEALKWSRAHVCFGFSSSGGSDVDLLYTERAF